jgi:hypothetical protein
MLLFVLFLFLFLFLFLESLKIEKEDEKGEGAEPSFRTPGLACCLYLRWGSKAGGMAFPKNELS